MPRTESDWHKQRYGKAVGEGVLGLKFGHDRNELKFSRNLLVCCPRNSLNKSVIPTGAKRSGETRELDYLPIIFDFERPADRDLTDTVKVLAGLSRFVIADITNPRCVPYELGATVPDYMVPFVTVLQRGQPAFGMFHDLPRRYHWALPLLEYQSAETLSAVFESKVVAPALEKLEDVRRQKALLPARRSAED